MVNRNRAQSFLEGAAVLTAATVVVKLIGALFKIPLANILGGVGMSYYTVAYDLFFIPLYSFAVTGFGIAVSRIVAQRAASGDRAGVEAVLQAAKKLFLSIGFFGMLIIWAVAPWVVTRIGNPASLFAVILIAPSVLFSCISAVYRGYYQGQSNMYPTAFSQIIESTVRLVAGIVFTYGTAAALAACYQTNGQLFGFTFENIAYARLFILRFAAAGGILGVTISTAAGAFYIRRRFHRSIAPYTGTVPRQRVVQSRRELVRIAIPIALSTLVVNLSSLIDLTSVMNCLHVAIARGSDQILAMYPGSIPAEVTLDTLPEYLYGSYSGLASSVFNLIPAITTALGVSAIPAVSRIWSGGDRSALADTISSILRMTMLIALPAGLGLSVLAEPILTFLFPSRIMEVTIVAPILRVMGLSAVLVAAATPINSILQSIGREKLPLIILLLGATVKLTTNLALVQQPQINIQGVPYGTLLCYSVIITLSTASLRLCSGVGLGLYRAVLKPLFCALGSSATAWLCYTRLPLSNTVRLFVAIATAMLIYIVLVLFTGTICKKDLKMLPFSENMLKRLEKIDFIR